MAEQSSFVIDWAKVGSGKPCLSVEGMKVYCDDEIKGKHAGGDITSVFYDIDRFVDYEYSQTSKIMETQMGDFPATVRDWQSPEHRMQFWIFEEGWKILYSNAKTFLIVENVGGHPQVTCRAFTFGNSDGSTTDDFKHDPLLMTFERVKRHLKKKSLKFVRHQVH